MSKKSITSNIDLSEIDINDRRGLEKITEELFQKMTNENKTFSEVIGLDETIVEQIYAFAYSHYNAGQYLDALSLFEFLIRLNPTLYKFSFGAAACLYQLKEYKHAAFLFSSAMHFAPEDPHSAFYLADCCLKEGLIEEAKVVLDHTIDIAKNNTEHSALINRCELIRKGL